MCWLLTQDQFEAFFPNQTDKGRGRPIPFANNVVRAGLDLCDEHQEVIVPDDQFEQMFATARDEYEKAEVRERQLATLLVGNATEDGLMIQAAQAMAKTEHVSDQEAGETIELMRACPEKWAIVFRTIIECIIDELPRFRAGYTLEDAHAMIVLAMKGDSEDRVHKTDKVGFCEFCGSHHPNPKTQADLESLLDLGFRDNFREFFSNLRR